MYKNRMASLIYKLVIVVVCLLGLLMNSGLLSGSFAPYVLLYYTIESNLLCLVFYIIAAIVLAVDIKNNGREGPSRFARHFKGGIVMAMVLAFVLFVFQLAQQYFANISPFAMFTNILAHVIVPAMVVIDWVLFDKKGNFANSDPIIWMVIPFIYYGIVLVAAQLEVQYYGGASYPYPFLDPDSVGWAPVLVHVILIVAIYAALGYILMGIDRGLGNRAKKQALARQVEAAGVQPATAAASTVRNDGLQDLSELVGGPAQPAAQTNVSPAGLEATAATIAATVQTGATAKPASPAPMQNTPVTAPAPAPKPATPTAPPAAGRAAPGMAMRQPTAAPVSPVTAPQAARPVQPTTRPAAPAARPVTGVAAPAAPKAPAAAPVAGPATGGATPAVPTAPRAPAAPTTSARPTTARPVAPPPKPENPKTD